MVHLDNLPSTFMANLQAPRTHFNHLEILTVGKYHCLDLPLSLEYLILRDYYYSTGFLSYSRLLFLECWGCPGNDQDVLCGGAFFYTLSPQIHLASWMSLGILVTLLAWIVHRFVSLNRPTKYASAASCRHIMAADWNCRAVFKS